MVIHRTTAAERKEEFMSNNENRIEPNEVIDHYNILLTPSSAYFLPAIVVMMSAILHCKCPCHFYVMESDWTEEQKGRCSDFIALYSGCEVNYITVDDNIFHIFKPFKNTYSTYYKLLAHKYLPSSVKKILYLDPDTMIRKDIYDFYSIKFEDNYFIATNNLMEAPYKKNRDFHPEKSKLHLLSNTNSNPGVLIINTEKLRNDDIDISTYENVLSEISDDNYWYEEGLLNYLFTYKRKYVEAYKWQTMIGCVERYKNVYSFSKEERIEKFNEFYADDLDEKNELAIIHFVNSRCGNKPWQTTFDSNNFIYDKSGKRLSPIEEPFYLEWWKTAEKLPVDLYFECVLSAKDTAHKTALDRLNGIVAITRNALNFCYEFCLDMFGEHKFERYLKSLRGKKVVLLKQQDRAGKILKNAADTYGINIILSSDKVSLEQITPPRIFRVQKSRRHHYLLCSRHQNSRA